MTETSGPILSESLGRWDQDSSSWRTCQVSLWEVMDGHHMGAPWSDSFPKSGCCQNGQLFPQHRQVRPISASDGGLWPTPTPTPRNETEPIDQWLARREREKALGRNGNGFGIPLDITVRMWPTPTSTERSGTNPHTGKGEGLSKTVKMFPTPRAGKTTDEDEESWLAKHADGKVCTPPLALAARMFPTPTSRDHKDSGQNVNWEPIAKKFRLAGVVQMLPTPSSGGESGKPHGIRGGSWPTPQHGSDNPAAHNAMSGDFKKAFCERAGIPMTGQLNPVFVEYLMGVPQEWTNLEPLAPEVYERWAQGQHWADGEWEGVPRISTGIKDRANRLKCLGNGIVPASLALFLRGTR